jgi:hypothetical protein
MERIDSRLNMKRVDLQRLRLALLVDLNRAYPTKLDVASLIAIHDHRGRRQLSRELHYLTEIGFLNSRNRKRWRITALGSDFLLGLAEAKGVMDPTMLGGDIGED